MSNNNYCHTDISPLCQAHSDKLCGDILVPKCICNIQPSKQDMKIQAQAELIKSMRDEIAVMQKRIVELERYPSLIKHLDEHKRDHYELIVKLRNDVEALEISNANADDGLAELGQRILTIENFIGQNYVADTDRLGERIEKLEESFSTLVSRHTIEKTLAIFEEKLLQQLEKLEKDKGTFCIAPAIEGKRIKLNGDGTVEYVDAESPQRCNQEKDGAIGADGVAKQTRRRDNEKQLIEDFIRLINESY